MTSKKNMAFNSLYLLKNGLKGIPRNRHLNKNRGDRTEGGVAFHPKKVVEMFN